MNEIIDPSEAMVNYTTKPKEVIDAISKILFQTRPQKEVRNIPYMKNVTYKPDKPLGRMYIDLKKLYPDAQKGDVVYTDFNLDSMMDIDMAIRTSTNITLIQDGNVLYDGSESGIDVVIPISVKKGYNLFTIKCVCEEDNFLFAYMPTTREYPFMWARDLLYNIRSTVPIEKYKNEEGVAFSRLFKSDETEAMAEFENGRREYVYPVVDTPTDIKDFAKLYGDQKGYIAYALSYASNDGTADIKFNSAAHIFVNGKCIYSVSSGENYKLSVKKGDEILIKSLREEKWGFSCDDTLFNMPHIESCRGYGDAWLLIGAFGKSSNLDLVYPPEMKISFNKPYYNADKQRVFWRLADGSYIRVYLDTFFFGQWYYALMVGHFALVNTYYSLGDKTMYDYFINSIKIFGAYYDYAKYDGAEFDNNPSMLPRTYRFKELDPIGTMGMNLCEAYFATCDDALLAVIRELEIALYKVPMFEDKVINRVETMWSDDLFMSCPFLVRLGLLSGKEEHFDMAYTQISGCYNRMFIKENKLFSHIFFVNDNQKSNVTWGRGNGWVMVTMVDFLANVPKTYKHYDDVLKIFREMSEGVANAQDERGMWHQVLDHHESFIESSCTAMFLFALSKGVKLGLLDKKYTENAKRAYKAILEHFVDKDGNIYGVCMGSGCSMDWRYYSDNLKTIKNEDHGTGIIMLSVSAYNDMIEK